MGSVIFLHCTKESLYTLGCVAIPEKNMIKVIKNANEKAVIIIDESKNIYNYQKSFYIQYKLKDFF